MRVINECRVDFKYRLTCTSPLISQTNFSNIVSTDIVRNILNIEKFVDKPCTYAFDILTYNIVIYNISNYMVSNIFFKDNIPKGTFFIENSLHINNIRKRCLSPEKGFYINKINPQNTISIKFKVRVLPQCFCETLKNFSNIQQNYIFNIEKPPVKLNIPSNTVISKVENKLFKQISIENTIKLKKDILKIVDFKVLIKILDTKIIHSPINSKYNKFKTNMSTLLVIGIIEYKIFFKTDNKNNNKTKVIKYIYGFSCIMITPVGIVYLEKDKIKVKIKHALANLLNNNTIITSTNILISFSDECQINTSYK
ncbi:MAG: hypothetical protein RR657_03095 [Peptostreptococcaceae bacterium]